MAKKNDRKKRKAMPEIFVKINNPTTKPWSFREFQYASAHIRVKAGRYIYLEWREGASIRSLYLGTRRERG